MIGSFATIPEALTAAAATTRGLQIIEDDGRSARLPYRALLDESLAAAGALRSQGLRRGDRVAIVVPEVEGFVRAFFAISAAGCVPVPMAPPAHAGDLPTFVAQSRHLFDASRAAAVVTTVTVAPLFEPADALRVLLVDALRDGRALAAPEPAATALIQFTSGSTAAPRGVVLTHANIAANIAAIAGPRGIDVNADDAGVSWLPLYHDMGLIGMLLTAVYAGADITLMSPVRFLKKPTAWLEAISSSRATVSFAPNFAYDLCVRRVKASQLDGLDLSRWRVAGCGAEPVRADTLRAFAAAFGPAGFRESSFAPSYGLAEHALAVTMRRGVHEDIVDGDALTRTARAIPAGHNSAASLRVVSCGRPFPDHELRVVDERNEPLPERCVGSIIARGPSVMQGYFEDPGATADVLRGGWLRTGDLGYLADGELFVCGRTKDLIVREGRKFHPPDLEESIRGIAGLRSAVVVVFGINQPGTADEVVAVIEARPSVAPPEVVDQVRRRVRESAGLDLDAIVVAPPGSIPRTTSGKVRRAHTRELYLAGRYNR